MKRKSLVPEPVERRSTRRKSAIDVIVDASEVEPFVQKPPVQKSPPYPQSVKKSSAEEQREKAKQWAESQNLTKSATKPAPPKKENGHDNEAPKKKRTEAPAESVILPSKPSARRQSAVMKEVEAQVPRPVLKPFVINNELPKKFSPVATERRQSFENVKPAAVEYKSPPKSPRITFDSIAAKQPRQSNVVVTIVLLSLFFGAIGWVFTWNPQLAIYLLAFAVFLVGLKRLRAALREPDCY